MKRGHNFGVVYVTNPTVEDETSQMRKKEHAVKIQDASYQKKKQLDFEVPRPPKGRENLGVNTSPVTSTIRPKPLVFEMGVQIDLYIDRPQTPLFWPQKTGVDKESQIEDGELFHFDEEVAPILNVLLSKVLEQSRMEVLEEEEIKEMKTKQREFEELRNRELTEVQKLEDKEARELAEKNRRVVQKKIEKENRIIYQKKLFTRQYAKEYLSKLKFNTVSQLEERGFFKNPIQNQLYNNLLPFILNASESINKNDYLVVNSLNDTFQENYLNNKKNSHKKSIQARREKIEAAKNMKLEEEERKIQEKQERKEARARLRKEKELLEIKNSINDEFIKKIEFVDMPENIFNINGNAQKKNYASAIGGYTGQLISILSYFSNRIPDFMNEEKLTKILESFLPKCPSFNLIYSAEDLETYKTLDGSVNAIEDILKLDDNKFGNIFSQITSRLESNDQILNSFIEYLTSMDYPRQEGSSDNIQSLMPRDAFTLLMVCLMKLSRHPEPTIADKVKFVMKDPSVVEDNNYKAICEVYPVQIANLKPSDNKKGSSLKKVTKGFEPYFQEKTATFPSISDKTKVIIVNYQFEAMLRSNLIECINKVTKFEDVDQTKEDFEDFYMNNIASPFIQGLSKDLEKEIIKFEEVDLPETTNEQNL